MKRQFADYLVSSGCVDSKAMDALDDLNWASREPVGRLALLHGLLGPTSIDRIIEQQRAAPEFFGQIAIQMGLLSREQLEVLLVGQAGRCCVELIEDLALARVLPVQEGMSALADFIQHNRLTAAALYPERAT